LYAAQQQELEDLIRMQGHMIAMEAPLYQSYRVYIINKVRAKTEIHLGKHRCTGEENNKLHGAETFLRSQ